MATRRKSEAGQALVFVALMLVALSTVMGLGIDMGYLRYEKRRIHEAADAAAIAGAAEVLYPSAEISSAAQSASTADGFTNGSNGVTVTVNHPPLSGPNTGNSNYVEAIVTQTAPTFFMRVLGVNSVPLSARSVAVGSSPNCIYALGTTGDAISISFSIITSACGVVDDSNLGGFLASLNATSIGLAGTNNGFLVSTNPTAQQHIPKAPDPFASLAAPAVGSCVTHPTQKVITTNTTLLPGTYCGGINILGGNVTFSPGVYVLNGGGFQMTNVFGGTVTGTGVTIFNTGTGSGGCTTCYGAVTTYFTGGSSLTAPTSGTYTGILFFQSSSNPQTASFNANFSFGTRPFMQGAYYFPDAQVQFNFDFGQSAAYTLLVAKSISWLVAFTFNNDFSTLTGGSPIRNTGVLTE